MTTRTAFCASAANPHPGRRPVLSPLPGKPSNGRRLVANGAVYQAPPHSAAWRVR
jgi:hypothetical protein